MGWSAGRVGCGVVLIVLGIGTAAFVGSCFEGLSNLGGSRSIFHWWQPMLLFGGPLLFFGVLILLSGIVGRRGPPPDGIA